jgi:hypothetical protein
VCNMMCIIAIVWVLYAASAVQLYADVLPEYFATFSQAATTLFQVCVCVRKHVRECARVVAYSLVLLPALVC